jgi:hypothetical protein
MLIPRFSIRWLLLVMTFCGLIAFIASQAIAGRPSGIALVAVVGSVLITALMFGSVFVMALWFAGFTRKARRPRALSPFATDTAPPQILTPHDPD